MPCVVKDYLLFKSFLLEGLQMRDVYTCDIAVQQNSHTNAIDTLETKSKP